MTAHAMTGLLRDLALGLGFAVYATKQRLRTGSWRDDLRTRNGDVRGLTRRAAGPRILVHGVSVGETHALQPLVEALAGSSAAPDVVVSASTATGHERAHAIHASRHDVVRFPLDFTSTANRFLDRVRPALVVLGELELWPSFLAACARRRIPVAVVNGRLSERSFRGYRRWRALVRPMFRQLALVSAQTGTYRDRFVALGVPAERAVVGGSLKWDAAARNPDPAEAATLAAALGVDADRPVIVAGSTGPGEEEALLRGLPDGCQLVLAPRSPDRWNEVARLVPGMPRRSRSSRLGPSAGHAAGRSQAAHAAPAEHPREPSRDKPQVFLLDTIGELPAAYLLADAVFVGRSLTSLGGSNPLEPAALGKPVVTGPHYEHFADIVGALEKEGGIAVSDDPMAVFRRWHANPESVVPLVEGAGRAMAKNRGLARSTAERILKLLQR